MKRLSKRLLYLHMISYMLFVSIVSDGTCLLAHFFHDGLFMIGLLHDSNSAGASSNLILSPSHSWINGKIFQADFQTAIKYFINNFTDSITVKSPVSLGQWLIRLTIAFAISGTVDSYYCVDDIFWFPCLLPKCEGPAFLFTHMFSSLLNPQKLSFLFSII